MPAAGFGAPAWFARPGRLALLALVLAAIVLARKPGVILHAELWGDDGWSWYPDAYTMGLRSLLLPVGGYLNTLQRLGGLIAQEFPLAWVPTVFALLALGVQVLPPVFLVSSRMAPVWPHTGARLLFALILVVLPNEIELYVNLTNAQWNLAMLAFLVLVSARPATRAAWVFDSLVLLLSGLSGPFCLFALPLAVWQVWEQRDATAWRRAAMVAATAAVQLLVLLHAGHGGRSLAPLGAGPVALARIVALQVILGAELGYATIGGLPDQPWWSGSTALPLLISAIAAALALLAWRSGPSLLRKLILFATLLLAAALVSPQASVTDPQWPILAIPPIGNRYFTYPMVAWLGVVFTLVAARHLALRAIGVVLLSVLCLWAIPRDWREPRFPATGFVARAHEFDAAPPGTRMAFPIIPPGLTPMVLVKRAP